MDLCLIGGISPRLPRMEARVDWVEAVAAMEGAEKGAAVGEALVMAGLEMAKGEVMGAMGVKVMVVVGWARGGAGLGEMGWEVEEAGSEAGTGMSCKHSRPASKKSQGDVIVVDHVAWLPRCSEHSAAHAPFLTHPPDAR